MIALVPPREWDEFGVWGVPLPFAPLRKGLSFAGAHRLYAGDSQCLIEAS